MQTFNFPYKHYMYTAKILITQPPYEQYNFISKGFEQFNVP
jgi:hypothetical protein